MAHRQGAWMLISCDECGGKVGDRATACPECGAPVVSGKESDHRRPSVQQPRIDHSTLQFRQNKSDRNKSGFPVGLTLTCLVAGGMAVFAYKSIVEMGPVKPSSLSRTGDGDAYSKRPSGSMKQEQFISCWNNNSNRLDQLAKEPSSPTGNFFVTRSPGIGLTVEDGSISFDVHPRNDERFARQAITAIQCTSDLSHQEAARLLVDVDAQSRASSGFGGLKFQGKRYSIYYFPNSYMFDVKSCRPSC